MGVSPQIIHFDKSFSLINHPAFSGTPMTMESPICSSCFLQKMGSSSSSLGCIILWLFSNTRIQEAGSRHRKSTVHELTVGALHIWSCIYTCIYIYTYYTHVHFIRMHTYTLCIYTYVYIYTDTHTVWTIVLYVLCFDFALNSSSTSEVREQITRVLLERLIVHRSAPKDFGSATCCFCRWWKNVCWHQGLLPSARYMQKRWSSELADARNTRTMNHWGSLREANVWFLRVLACFSHLFVVVPEKIDPLNQFV